jgi:hypothetical protein
LKAGELRRTVIFYEVQPFGHAQPVGFGEDDSLGFVGLRRDDRAAAGAQNTGFGPGDFSDRATEDLRMLQADVGDHR